MPQYSLKNPMIVEARRFDGTEHCAMDLSWWVGDALGPNSKNSLTVEVDSEMGGDDVRATLYTPTFSCVLKYGSYLILFDGVFRVSSEEEFLEHFEPHYLDRTIP